MHSFLTKQSFKQCDICAYHESGHILFAYLCGYRCRQVQLINDVAEEGYSSIAIIDYGKDSFIASKFLGANASIDSFKGLPLSQKLASIETGKRIARIFLGGSVAAAVYKNDGNVHIPLPIQIEYVDLLRVEFIQCLLHEISSEDEEDFIEAGLQDALYTFNNINVWNTTADLAQRLLQHKELLQNDIEECLEEHGIMYDQEFPAITG